MTGKDKKRFQVISCKVPYDLYDQYEIACCEKQQTISKALQEAIKQVVAERQKQLHLN